MLLVTLFYLFNFNTPQVYDAIEYKGQSYSLIGASPLESNLYEKGVEETILKNGFNTACWRGFVAQWKVKDEHLLLTDLVSCGNNENLFTPEFLSSIGLKYDSTGVPFPYFNGDLLLGRNPISTPYFMDALFKEEVALSIKDGVVLESEEFDNSRTYISSYEDDIKEFSRMLIWNLDTTDFDLSKTERFAVAISSGDHEKPISKVEILKSSNEQLNPAIEAAILEFPEWSVIYQKGKVTSHKVAIYLTINREVVSKFKFERH